MLHKKRYQATFTQIDKQTKHKESETEIDRLNSVHGQ